MNKILIADTYYPEFLKSQHVHVASYAAELNAIMQRSFGTFDAYSRNLRELGWEANDLIVNAEALQAKWEREYESGCEYQANVSVFAKQIAHYEPDVLFLQDLNVPLPEIAFHGRIVAGQCSCPMPPEQLVEAYDVLFTSFPHYLARFKALGVFAVYNPLGFDPIVLDRIDHAGIERNLDVVFVGGVGNPSHWQRGMETLEAIARAIPAFKWWGYGVGSLPAGSALYEKYQGPAWGLDMYRLFRRAKVVVNRHGEVAEGYANNMRLYEATGCGAALLTESAENLSDFFVSGDSCHSEPEVATYDNPKHAVEMIRFLLGSPTYREAMAAAGQRRTLKEHTYRQRMQNVSRVLERMCPS